MTIYVIGDDIRDIYIPCKYLGQANEANTSKLRTKAGLIGVNKYGGIHFVRSSISALVSQGQSVFSPIHSVGTSLWNILRYTANQKTHLTVETVQWQAPDDFPIVNFHPTLKDIVVFWDDDKSSHKLLRSHYDLAIKAGSTIVVDSSRRDVFQAYPKADIFKISGDELKQVTGTKPSGSKLIITHKDGTILRPGCYEFSVKIVENPVDTIGAGDVFLARLVYGLWNHEELPDIIPEANRLARASIGYPGCYFPKEEM